MRRRLLRQKNLVIKEAEAQKLIVQDGKVLGVITNKGAMRAECVVICPGTFLNGLIHVGLKHFSGGRINEPACLLLADNLKELGFNLLRFKTGTCPRLDKNSINYLNLIRQDGDLIPRPFSFSTKSIKIKQVPCYITYTNEKVHRILETGFKDSPLYTGIIQGVGFKKNSPHPRLSFFCR